MKVIRDFFAHLPAAIDVETRELCEVTLADIASHGSPEAVRDAGHELLAHLHPDGDFSDEDRQRQRGVSLGPQGPDGMSRLSGHLTPELRATLEAVFAKWAAPGMCNRYDTEPIGDGEPDAEAAQRDSRNPTQRRHDAMLAMGRSVLASGELGRHHGLPATIVVTTTLQDLEAGTGHAVTAGGTRLPMRDVIGLAAWSHHYLAVFDRHTKEPLYLGRARRCATGAQWLMLFARERGCSRPGCTVAAYGAQVHHAVADWKRDGQTNIDELTLACGPDNRMIELTDWRTRKRKDGVTEWIPPPHLDTGQARTNDLHHPERLLAPKDEPDEDDDCSQ